jgi:pilus assembly protein Flp/PilA
MAKLVTAVLKFFGKEEGASIIEYALLLALLAVVCVTAMSVFGNSLSNLFSTAATTI